MKTPDLTGNLVSHQKARSGSVEFSLKPKFRYCSINIGVWPKDKMPDTEDAKKELMNLGWFLTDDIIDVLGQEEAEKMFNSIVQKYNLRVRKEGKDV
jgi:hypothetical protein